jgi:predicted membrane channel-forming protein YqfA (hemolysin III family)
MDGLADSVTGTAVASPNPTPPQLSNTGTTVNPQKKFHLVFSLLMGLMMIFLMTFVITAVNVGFGANFLQTWAKAFVIAYFVGVPVIFFLAPVARKLTARALGMPLP